MNGLWAVFLSFGLLYTAWELHNARRWIIGPAWFRNFLADYGVVSMVWLWTGISYAVKRTPPGTIRRLVIPNTWEYHSFWTVARVRRATTPRCWAMCVGLSAVSVLSREDD